MNNGLEPYVIKGEANHLRLEQKLGRLFVMTFEKGERAGYYIYDIFNPAGVFIGWTSLDNTGNESLEIWGGPFEVRSKNNLLYYLRAKESGFQEVVVCRMIWTE